MTQHAQDTQKMIGTLLDATAARDAIHIAVAPAVAGKRLLPAQHVAIVDGKAVPATGDAALGVVDPYLTVVMPGERFFIFLLPNTITSLRHAWTHPAFTDEGAAPVENESRAWIEGFAAELDQTYNRLMAAAETWVLDEEYTYDNTETYKRVDSAKWPMATFWKHYEIVTGTKVKDHTAHFFTCSC